MYELYRNTVYAFAFYQNLLLRALSTILKPYTPMKLWLTTCGYVIRLISMLLWRICVPASWQLQRKKSKACSTRWESNTLLLSSTILRGSSMKCENSARNKPFAPNNKTKALLLQRKPYCQNESWAIVLLCTQRGKWVHPSFAVFQKDSGAKEKVTEQGCKTANSGCICRFSLEFCKNKKQRTETLYQSFSPFMWNDSKTNTIPGYRFAIALSFCNGCIWVQNEFSRVQN